MVDKIPETLSQIESGEYDKYTLLPDYSFSVNQLNTIRTLLKTLLQNLSGTETARDLTVLISTFEH